MADLGYVGFGNACILQRGVDAFVVVEGGGGYGFNWEEVSFDLYEDTMSWVIEHSEPTYAPGESRFTVLVTGTLLRRVPTRPGAYVLSINDTCLPFVVEAVLERLPRLPSDEHSSERWTCFDTGRRPELRRQ